MHDVPNTTGSESDGESCWEVGDSPTPLTGKAFYQDLIRKANTVPIIRIFKHYGLRLSERSPKITCPFKSHKGGRERTPSFQYYPETNTYYCHGCKACSRPCDFVAEMDGIIKSKAASKIIGLFKDDVDFDADVGLDYDDMSEKLEIIMDFSNTVREFRNSNFDEKSYIFIEHMCWIYDDLNARLEKKFDNKALYRIVEQLKEEIISYKPCP